MVELLNLLKSNPDLLKTAFVWNWETGFNGGNSHNPEFV